MKVQPLRDQVVLGKPFMKETTEGGIIKAPGYGRPDRAEVLAVGPGLVSKKGKRLPMTLKVGDVVLFDAYGAHQDVPGEDGLIMVRESDIIGVFE